MDTSAVQTSKLHPNLKLLSHSGRTQLHRCPRKFELQKILQREQEDDRHTVFGSAFGAAVEHMVKGGSRREAIWIAFTSWRTDLLSTGDEKAAKDGKTFWDCLIGLQVLEPVLRNLQGRYKILTVRGRQATELGFKLELNNGFIYRGFIDVVLLDLQTNELVVLELKTTKSTEVHPATHKNSGQALGYSLVLDIIASEHPELALGSSYKVLYLIYKTKKREFELMPFEKHHMDRAVWLMDLVIDCKTVELYGEFGNFPKHGESCLDFFRPCEFFDTCGLSNNSLLAGKEPVLKVEADDKYDFSFTLDQVIANQLERGAAV